MKEKDTVVLLLKKEISQREACRRLQIGRTSLAGVLIRYWGLKF